MFCRFGLIGILMSFSSLFSEESSHKIVHLVSGPRTLSTVFLRMMESRGDFVVYNEPMVASFAKENVPEHASNWFSDDIYSKFDEVKKDIYASAILKRVFIKEMSFAFYKYILGDQEYIKNPLVYFLLLVRDPHHSIISCYRKMGSIPSGQSEMIGLKNLYEEYQVFKRLSPNKVKIIFSDQLYRIPREVMLTLCDHLKIPFLEEMFTWKKYENTGEVQKVWKEQKNAETMTHWHGKALQSTKMGKPSEYKIDSDGKPTFEEIENEIDREQLKVIYLENLVYYQKFLDAQENFLL